MKRSYIKFLIFSICILIVLLLNSFILNILGNYYYMDIFLLILLILFKFIFGIEKDGHRYKKDIIINMTIILFIAFILYYIMGIFIGFYKPTNYLNIYGITTFIIPFVVMIILKEYLRYQMLNKTDKSKILTVSVCVLFILIDLLVSIRNNSFDSNYNIFMFIALVLLPVISRNICCTFIAKKVGYKPNIFWRLIVELYVVFLPIVPDSGLYINSLIEFLFPFVLLYNVYSFYKKREKNVPISYIKKRVFIEIPTLAMIVFILAYFVSGYFRFYAIAIASGSMLPNIRVGDVVIVDQHKDYKDLKVGDVIAFRHDGLIMSHRIYDIVVVKGDYYFYTKGDANEEKDNYVTHPENIIGKVNVKVPYMGLPTVWLNKLFG